MFVYHVYPSSRQLLPSSRGQPPIFLRMSLRGSSPDLCGEEVVGERGEEEGRRRMKTSIVSLSMQEWKTALAIWKGFGSPGLIGSSRRLRT